MGAGSTNPDIHYIAKYNKSVNWEKRNCESSAFQGVWDYFVKDADGNMS